MVDEHGLVKVLDFGLAKLTEPHGPEAETVVGSTGEGKVLGTAAYMSPEQAEGKKVDPRSDIFSFGSVLYEMLTGQRAFQADTRASTIASILREEPKPVSQVAKGLPREVERIVKRCLRKDPEHRFQTMADLRVALEELKEESESGALETGGVSKPKPHQRLIWMSIIVTVLGIAAVGFWFLRSKGQAPEAPMTIVPLTSYPGEERSPSFSPDGNQVAFSWNGEKEDNFDIYVKLINSPKPLRLTFDPAWDDNPAFSPDGLSIAFTRMLKDRIKIMSVPAISGPERELAEFQTTDAVSLSWFPDGKWIVTDGLALISVETGEVRKLTGLPTESYIDFTPAVSPDGRAVAYGHGRHVSEICLLGLTPDLRPKGEPKQLTFMKRTSSSPAWTADGREIIFVSAIPEEYSLWRISISGSDEPKLQFPGSSRDRNPTISRRGNRLAFTRDFSDMNIYRLSLQEPVSRRSAPERFLPSSRDELVPKYSPDGRQIAFMSSRTGVLGLWVSNADGSNPVEVFEHGEDPQWAPDGQRLVFISRAAGPMAVYVTRASGGKPVRMTFGDDSGNACWSHDGKWIYFDPFINGRYQIWKIPSGGGEPIQVTENGGLFLVESRDGRLLYFASCNQFPYNKLWKTPVDGGIGSEVLPSVYISNFELMEDGVYFIPWPDKSGKGELKFLNFATNTVKTIAPLTGKIGPGLAVSPDRCCVLYVTNDLSGSDLILVENFR